MINEIDPRIYNFKNLKLEDQVVVASQFKIFLLVKKEKEDLKETADKQNTLFPYTTLFRSGSEERRVGKEGMTLLNACLLRYNCFAS